MSFEGKFYGSIRKVTENISTPSFEEQSKQPVSLPEVKMPARRLNVVCANLIVEGQPSNNFEPAELKAMTRYDKAKLFCTVRKTHLAADYAQYMCMSSYCKVCPFIG